MHGIKQTRIHGLPNRPRLAKAQAKYFKVFSFPELKYLNKYKAMLETYIAQWEWATTLGHLEICPLDRGRIVPRMRLIEKFINKSFYKGDSEYFVGYVGPSKERYAIEKWLISHYLLLFTSINTILEPEHFPRQKLLSSKECTLSRHVAVGASHKHMLVEGSVFKRKFIYINNDGIDM